MKIKMLFLLLIYCSQFFASSRKYEEPHLPDFQRAALVQEKKSKYAVKDDENKNSRNCMQQCCAWFSSLIVDIVKTEKRIKDSNEYVKYHGLTSQRFSSDECLNK